MGFYLISNKEREDLAEFNIFLFGLIFGSFLNMLIYRLPLEISLINPKRSICTNCNIQIKWYENLPVISYIILKGKCSFCKEKISLIYPIVELLTGIITLLLFLKLGLNVDFIITTLLFYVLIILSFIDFKYKAVPDYLLIIALLISFSIIDFSFQNMLLFAGGFVLLNFFITFYIQNIKSKITKNEDLKYQEALGEGDIPIVAIIGGFLGLKLGMIAIFISAILALFPALYSSIVKKDIETPFIPFLVLGLLIVFIWEKEILSIIERIML
jgi:leader peptidase (prepilin peptidase)/N-methyltransferase